MAEGARTSWVRHLVGLCLTVVLALGGYGLWTIVPMLLQATFLQRIELLVMFLCLVVLLTLAERAWVFVTARLQCGPPE